MSVFLRVNGDMLKECRGKNVCILGKLINTEQSSFEIQSADSVSIKCKLKMPIRDSLSDIVEVYGTVDEKGNINCENYATFEPSQIENFDMELHKETVVMMYQLQEHYIQEMH